MRVIIFVVGYCALELLASHWSLKSPLGDASLTGIFIYAAIMDIVKRR